MKSNLLTAIVMLFAFGSFAQSGILSGHVSKT